MEVINRGGGGGGGGENPIKKRVRNQCESTSFFI